MYPKTPKKRLLSDLRSLYVINYFRYDHPFGMPFGENYDHDLDYLCFKGYRCILKNAHSGAM